MNDDVGGMYSGFSPVQSSASICAYPGSDIGKAGSAFICFHIMNPPTAAIAATRATMPRIKGTGRERTFFKLLCYIACCGRTLLFDWNAIELLTLRIFSPRELCSIQTNTNILMIRTLIPIRGQEQQT